MEKEEEGVCDGDGDGAKGVDTEREREREKKKKMRWEEKIWEGGDWDEKKRECLDRI